MTVKELCAFCNKDKATISRWIAKAKLQNATIQLQNATTKTKGRDYTIDEVEAILNASTLSKDAVAILMKNARETQAEQGNINRDLAPISNMQSCLSLREIEIISSIVSMSVQKTVEAIEPRLARLEKVVGEQILLPFNNEIDVRTRINVIVRKYATENNVDIKSVWHKLYKVFGYKTHTNPSLCAKNRGMSIIDYIESEGQLDVLEKIALAMIKCA